MGMDAKQPGRPDGAYDVDLEPVGLNRAIPLPMLVTGIAGVPGYNAFHYFRQRYGDQVLGIRQPNMWPLDRDGIVVCDIENADAVEELWKTHRFASLLNCAGGCRLKPCELDPEMAHRVNVLGTENMLRCARRDDATVIHLSIDLVFGGRDGGDYRETDTPDPVTVYGTKMAEAERVVLSLRPDACVLRISLPMGVSFSGHAGAIDWISSRFKQGKPATLLKDEFRTPTYTDCLNELMERLLESPLRGLYHAGGPRRLSLFEIAQIVNLVGGYDPDLLMGRLRSEIGTMPPRAGDVSLNSSKLYDALGECPFDGWPLDMSLVPTHREWHHERNEFRGSADAVTRLLYQNPSRMSELPLSREERWGVGRFN